MVAEATLGVPTPSRPAFTYTSCCDAYLNNKKCISLLAPSSRGKTPVMYEFVLLKSESLGLSYRIWMVLEEVIFWFESREMRQR